MKFIAAISALAIIGTVNAQSTSCTIINGVKSCTTTGAPTTTTTSTSTSCSIINGVKTCTTSGQPTTSTTSCTIINGVKTCTTSGGDGNNGNATPASTTTNSCSKSCSTINGVTSCTTNCGPSDNNDKAHVVITPSGGPRCDFDLKNPVGHPSYSKQKFSDDLKDGVRTIKNTSKSDGWFTQYYKLKPGVDKEKVRCDFKVIDMQSQESFLQIGHCEGQTCNDPYWPSANILFPRSKKMTNVSAINQINGMSWTHTNDRAGDIQTSKLGPQGSDDKYPLMLEIGFSQYGEYVEIIDNTISEVEKEKIIQDKIDGDNKKLIKELQDRVNTLKERVKVNAGCENNFVNYKTTVNTKLAKFDDYAKKNFFKNVIQ